jgi:SAM-dependent methyltransferase
METQQVPPQAVILHIIADYWRSRAVYLAARLKLADAVGNSRPGLADLAAATATRPEALRRLLRALTAHGIFREEDDGKFTQTPLSEVLRSGSTGSMRAFAEVELGHDHYDSWRDAESCLTLPGTAFERIFNMPIWRYYAEHPELEALFGEAMTNLTAIANAGVLGSYQFGTFGNAVDVGGGHGSFLAAVLDGNPAATGILFDLPSVIEDATKGEFVGRLGDRVRLVGGDFFKEVPAGADLYLLKFVLHDWHDTDCVRILANIRRAIAPGGRLALVEMVLPGRNEPHLGPLMDLNMMVMTGGIERTGAEYSDLLAKAGFQLECVTGTKSPFSVVEAVPI